MGEMEIRSPLQVFASAEQAGASFLINTSFQRG